jgi:branched-chain amino acid transport system permease protein
MLVSIDIITTVVNGLMAGGIYGLASLGLNIMFGTLRILNVAHGALMMIALYFNYWLYTLYNVDPLIGALIVLLLFFPIGMLLYQILINPFRRLKPLEQELFPVITTLGLALIAENLALTFWSADPRMISVPYLQSGVKILNLYIASGRLVVLAITILAYLLIYSFLKYTYTGLAIKAFIQNPVAASLMGVDIRKLPLVASGIGVAITGFSASLLTPLISIDPRVGWQFLLLTFVVVTLGGLGSVIGSVVGGLLIGFLESFTVAYYKAMVFPVLLVLVFLLILSVKPTGIWGFKA